MAMPQRDNLIEHIHRLEGLIAVAEQQEDWAEFERLKERLRALIDQTRQKIYETACSLIEEKGFANVSPHGVPEGRGKGRIAQEVHSSRDAGAHLHVRTLWHDDVLVHERRKIRTRRVGRTLHQDPAPRPA